ncbi:MAG: Holliday junction branch migration protein RuvA [Clostridiales bacterium]
MISFIRGRIWAVENDGVIVEVSGIGIKVFAPLSTMDSYPQPGEDIFLHTHLQIREDAWQLYGFMDKEQLRLFRLLLAISGIGAKTALALIDGVSLTRFAAAVAAQDIKPLTAVSGVGKKTAERLLLELKDKFSALQGEIEPLITVGSADINDDLVAALKQLGYSAVEARAYALAAVKSLGSDQSPEQLLREALKQAYKS